MVEMNLGILSSVKQSREIIKAKESPVWSSLGQQKLCVAKLQPPRKSQKKNIAPKGERTLGDPKQKCISEG